MLHELRIDGHECPPSDLGPLTSWTGGQSPCRMAGCRAASSRRTSHWRRSSRCTRGRRSLSGTTPPRTSSGATPMPGYLCSASIHKKACFMHHPCLMGACSQIEAPACDHLNMHTAHRIMHWSGEGFSACFSAQGGDARRGAAARSEPQRSQGGAAGRVHRDEGTQLP